jgi:hypothetical protein
MSIHTSPMPRQVRTAALLLVAYGVMVVAHALILQQAGGWAEAREFPRALLRLFGCGLIAFGLMRGLRWAWWVGVIAAGFWSLMGGGALLIFARTGAWDQLPMPAVTGPVLFVGVLLVAGALALLLQPGSRDAFR